MYRDNISARFYKSKGYNGVRDAKLAADKKSTLIFTGIIIGGILPFLIDMVLFNTPFPCHSIQVFKDGSSIQECGVRR